MIAKGILTSWRRHISCTAGRPCPPAARWGSLERCRRNKALGRFWTYYLGGWYFLVLGVFGVWYFGVVSSNVSISVRLKHLFPFLLLLLKLLFLGGWSIGWSEKHKSWKMQQFKADSEPRHSTDFRSIFGIMIGWFVLCEIGQTYFTESGGSFEIL